jgi:hypothetical protein
VLECYVLTADFILFDKSVKIGDSIAAEIIMTSWIWVMALTAKSKYRDLIACWIEVVDSMSPAQLQSLRINAFVRLHADKGMIAKDDMCEKINQWLKKMRNTADADRLAVKSQFLSWMRRCNISEHGWFNSSPDVSSSTPPASTAEKRAVYKLLRDSKATTPIAGRTFEDQNHFWRHAEKMVVPKEKSSSSLSAAARTVNALFGKSYKSHDEVQKEEAKADAAEERDGASAACEDEGQAEEGEEVDGDVAEEESSEAGGGGGKRYPLSSRAVAGPLKTAGFLKLAHFAAQRAAVKSEMSRERDVLCEAAEMDKERCLAVEASVEELMERMLERNAAQTTTAQGTAPADGAAGIPTWRLQYNQQMAGEF